MPDARLSSFDRHRRAEEVFLEAAAAPPERRAAVLDELCGSDSNLRVEVESLLGSHDDGHGLLDSAVFATPAGGFGGRGGPPAEALPHGRRIGAYTVQGVLGSGGMGVVYVAEQERPRRTVALKVIRPGLATPQLLRRFELEAEALGRLHHPGIAQIYEAGAADTGLGPQPYFAMEFVKGKPLTTHADERRLDHRSRMALVALVCDAVQHAHQRGVIHRDLKPGNILVDESGQPKVLDFGVSRLASADVRSTTIETSVGQLIGTLPYMSPEQVGGSPEEVDTRSDVYALGVILYQTLTGRLPHDVGSRSIPDAARVIRDETPARLSSVSKVFRGEVDTIVSTALEKDKTRRYQSAAALGDDIRRYLSGAPINAKRDSAMYVLRKQIRRHRVAAAAAFIVAGLVIGFGVVSALQARTNQRLATREKMARLEADRARDIAREETANADADAARLRRGLYFSSIGFAQAAYSSHDTESMRRRLAECPEDLRNWEWGYLSQLVDDSERTIVRTCANGEPSAGAATLYLAQDVGLLLTTDVRESLILWDAHTGERKSAITKTGLVTGAAISPSGETIYCQTYIDEKTKTCAIDSRTGQARWSKDVPLEAMGRCHLTADGSTLVIVGRRSLHLVLDAATGEERARFDDTKGGSITLAGAASPDGSLIATTEESGVVHLWDVGTKRLRATLKGHHGSARCAAFSPNSALLATGGSDGSVRVWDATACAERLVIWAHDNKVWAVAWTPDGSTVASAGTDTTIVFSSATSGERVASMHGHAVTVAGLEFTRDGRWLISTSRDALMKWWPMPPRPATPLLARDERCMVVAMTQDSARFAVGWADGEASIHSAVDGAELAHFKAHQGELWGLGFSPDGATLYSAGWDGAVRAWDGKKGDAIASFDTGKESIYRMAVANDGRVAVVCGGGGVFVLNPGLAGTARRYDSKHGTTTAVAWSPDSKQLATGGKDFIVRVWDVATGEEVCRFAESEGDIYSVVWSPDGKTIYGGCEDWKIRAWDVETRAMKLCLTTHGGPVYCLALNPRGDRLASGSFDNNVKVWDAKTGEDILTLRGHIQSVTTVKFSADGKWIASGNEDGTLRLWGFARGAAPAIRPPLLTSE